MTVILKHGEEKELFFLMRIKLIVVGYYRYQRWI